MTRDHTWDDLVSAARTAWDNVPAYLRQPRNSHRWGSCDVHFSDKRDAR